LALERLYYVQIQGAFAMKRQIWHSKNDNIFFAFFQTERKTMKIISKWSLLVLPFFFVLLNAKAVHINYRDAFNQSDIHKRYENLLKSWGCDTNVFDQVQPSTLAQTKIDGEDLIELEKKYQKACLKRLFSVRRRAITTPALASLVMIGLMACSTTVISRTLTKNSYLQSYSIYNSISSCIPMFGSILEAIHNLVFPRVHPLDTLEEHFAKNKCFIPKTLWPAITEKFMIARNNQFEQQANMNFLYFALGLTTYKPKLTLHLSKNDVQGVIDELHQRIDQFFGDYYQPKTTQTCCQLIKLNVSKFVLNLLGSHDNPPRYISFHGPAGIGKTFFVRQLSEWIEELLPGTVNFESMVIASPEELEGNKQRPGAILRVLNNQLKADKRGSVVFIDEATWLNDPRMASCAKRVFNGDQSTLSTDYFGVGIDGVGVNLTMPPMLIFVASNEEIKNPALKSRFDVIKYPLPSQKALVEHACAIAAKSTILNNAHIPSKAKIENWIVSDNINNFRSAQAGIERFVLSQ